MNQQQEESSLEAEIAQLRQRLQRAEEALLSRRVASHCIGRTKPVRTNLQLRHNAVNDIHKWLFGAHSGELKDVQGIMTEYAVKLRALGIPVDRMLIHGGLHRHVPAASACLWKWELSQEFEEREIPRHVYDRIQIEKSPDEPFIVLSDGRADRFRMTAGTSNIPGDCDWFVKDGYKDYVALPIKHQGEFRGAIDWATKDADGFLPSEIQFLESTVAALSAVICLHTNERVLQTLSAQLEEEVMARTEALSEANRRLEEANYTANQQAAAQLEHFASMSHEIRTPLNCIVGLSNLLLEEEDLTQGAVRESIELITASGDLLRTVVDDVLDYSKLAAGHIDFDVAPCLVKETVQTVIDAVAVQGAARNLVIRSSFCDDLPECIETDRRRLQQILYNLLGNAVKFSNDDGGAIDVTATTTLYMGEQRLRIAVRDHGKGIQREELENIFRPFHQTDRHAGAEASTERVYGGTGLGLSVASKLVHGLGGSITVDSEYGHGCEFVIDIPCIPCKRVAPAIQASPVVADLRSLANLKVLIAEDNVINQKVLRRAIAKLGVADITVVNNGQEAVDICCHEQFAVIFMDISMPVMDGLEATRIIKATKTEKQHEPKIIFLSAHATDSYKIKTEEAGGDGFISKPFRLPEVKAVFESLRLVVEDKTAVEADSAVRQRITTALEGDANPPAPPRSSRRTTSADFINGLTSSSLVPSAAIRRMSLSATLTSAPMATALESNAGSSSEHARHDSFPYLNTTPRMLSVHSKGLQIVDNLPMTLRANAKFTEERMKAGKAGSGLPSSTTVALKRSS